jgi:hypothetical protein
LTEATQEAQNGLNRQRKGKNSNFSKLSEIGIIAKSASQDFQQHKRLIKRSYGSKDIHGQRFGQPSPISIRTVDVNIVDFNLVQCLLQTDI